jgi:arsenical pump membrane protein
LKVPRSSSPLLGANIGPNLTYAGSLATLLWRRIVHAHEEQTNLREFTGLAVAWAVPAGLGAATVALWVSLRLIGKVVA